MFGEMAEQTRLKALQDYIDGKISYNELWDIYLELNPTLKRESQFEQLENGQLHRKSGKGFEWL